METVAELRFSKQLKFKFFPSTNLMYNIKIKALLAVSFIILKIISAIFACLFWSSSINNEQDPVATFPTFLSPSINALSIAGKKHIQSVNIVINLPDGH